MVNPKLGPIFLGVRVPRFSIAWVLLLPVLAFAQPIAAEQIPDSLRPWVPWVLDEAAAEVRCTRLHQAETQRCAWPGRLELTLDERGGRFSQSWWTEREEWVALPGDAKRWPLDVRVDGLPGIVSDRSGTPALRLKAGRHVLSGTFAWDSLPEALRVSPDTGLVALTLRGARVVAPQRDEEGQLYLSQTDRRSETDDLEISVVRKMTDEVPLLLATRMELRVSGKSREAVLGRVLPPGFLPLALSSPFPARLEADGRLRLQVRPGTWEVTLTARSAGPVQQLTRPQPDGLWAEGEEIWTFEPKPALRLVDVEGVSAVDPQQTRLPEEWKRLAAYPLKVGDVLILKERRRGDSDPAPDQLHLSRQLWMDFDGGGYTVNDTLTGRLQRTSRLLMGLGTELGRVEMNGRDQFITKLEDGLPGVEVRDVQLQVKADSRIPGARTDLSAVGWQHDFQSVEATLNLPPGWRLLHATGADEVPGTWIRRWTLLDFFLLLMTGLALGKLFGARWGALALVTLALITHEADAPRWLWLALLAGEALVRVLPEGRVKLALRGYRLGVAVTLALSALFFVAKDVRAGLYPALERPYQSVSPVAGLAAEVQLEESQAPQAPAAADEGRAEQATSDAVSDAASSVGNIVAGYKGGKPKEDFGQAVLRRKANRQVAQDVDRSVNVQTGPGLPQWNWDQVWIRWNGPVEMGQRLRLYYLSPIANLFLALLRFVLVTLLVVRLLPIPQARWLTWLGRASPGAVVLAFALVFGVPGPADAQSLPSKELLDELRARLLRPAACQDNCATAGRLLLEASPSALTLRMEIHAAANTAVPLPGRAEQWLPETVTVDGNPSPGVYRSEEGVLWVPLRPGAHQIVLQGALARAETVQVALPLRPHHVAAKLSGWTLAGLHEDGLADADLELTRVRAAAQSPGDERFQAGALPPFVHVRRTLALGLDWEVNTEVERVSPLGSAVVLEVPLLPGEAVTTDTRVVNGKALINLGANASQASWRSTLPRSDAIRLTAPREVAWVEIWEIDVSPLWHATLSGIPPIHRGEGDREVLPVLRPWPGESVDVRVQRPQGLSGQTLTIDQTRRSIRPGLRATDVELTLSLRSSRGGQHAVLLPERALLQSVKLNGREQPIRQEGRKVVVPVSPGAQTAALVWREPTGIGTIYRSASADLGTPSVNAHTALSLSKGRWVLFAGGPRLGPSVLFWSLLLVLLVTAFGLSRSTLAPLRFYEWALLLVGLSQVPLVAAAGVAGWLLVLGWRGNHVPASRAAFNARQALLAAWTVAALLILAAAIREGLLGRPDMQIAGNGSSSSELLWFDDRTGPRLSSVWVFSVPVLVYRLAMLAWAIWIARALLKWLRWGWGQFTEGGLWRHLERVHRGPPPPPVPGK
ncbi:MAG: hypothetical protein ACKVPX_07345 [Myxococcaceae bacterium]